jgi:hypothetical protein
MKVSPNPVILLKLERAKITTGQALGYCKYFFNIVIDIKKDVRQNSGTANINVE